MEAIKPIETRYKGYRFRSRLEARWAVFFDALDLRWEYEPEGFKMSNGKCYLPDFYLPDVSLNACLLTEDEWTKRWDSVSGETIHPEIGEKKGVYIEIKPDTLDSVASAREIIQDNSGNICFDKNLVVMLGLPLGDCNTDDVRSFQIAPIYNQNIAWYRCSEKGYTFFDDEGNILEEDISIGCKTVHLNRLGGEGEFEYRICPSCHWKPSQISKTILNSPEIEHNYGFFKTAEVAAKSARFEHGEGV
jgi:hypothetical protein